MAFDDVSKYNEMVNNARIEAILKAQEQIESSGGRNVDHAEIDYNSMHKGTSAKGRYGIMPLTLKDLAKSMSRDKEAQEAASIEDEQQLKDYFASHPALEDRLARQYIERANKSMGGDYDPEKITYAWQWGQNKTPEQFQKDKESNPEVNKRWAKVKSLFKDPYPPQGPQQLPDSERALAQNDPAPQAVPSPMPNFSPEQEEVATPMEFKGETEIAEEPQVENKFQQLSQVFSPKNEFKKMEPENMYKEQFSIPVKNKDEPIREERALTPRLMSMLMEKRRK